MYTILGWKTTPCDAELMNVSSELDVVALRTAVQGCRGIKEGLHDDLFVDIEPVSHPPVSRVSAPGDCAQGREETSSQISQFGSPAPDSEEGHKEQVGQRRVGHHVEVHQQHEEQTTVVEHHQQHEVKAALDEHQRIEVQAHEVDEEEAPVVSQVNTVPDSDEASAAGGGFAPISQIEPNSPLGGKMESNDDAVFVPISQLEPSSPLSPLGSASPMSQVVEASSIDLEGPVIAELSKNIAGQSRSEKGDRADEDAGEKPLKDPVLLLLGVMRVGPT